MIEPGSEGTMLDPGELHLPVFVLLATGDLWAYPAVRQLDLDMRALTAEDLRAWDGTGRRLRLVGDEGNRLLVVDPVEDDKAPLQNVLLEKLRERRVSGVEAMSFDELVEKASIRFVISQPDPWWKRFLDFNPLPW